MSLCLAHSWHSLMFSMQRKWLIVIPHLNLYPQALLSSRALNGLSTIQNSRGYRASPLYIPHLMVACAILSELADRVVLQCDIDCLIKVTNLGLNLYSLRHSSIHESDTKLQAFLQSIFAIARLVRLLRAFLATDWSIDASILGFHCQGLSEPDACIHLCDLRFCLPSIPDRSFQVVLRQVIGRQLLGIGPCCGSISLGNPISYQFFYQTCQPFVS